MGRDLTTICIESYGPDDVPICGWIGPQNRALYMMSSPSCPWDPPHKIHTIIFYIPTEWAYIWMRPQKMALYTMSPQSCPWDPPHNVLTIIFIGPSCVQDLGHNVPTMYFNTSFFFFVKQLKLRINCTRFHQ